MNITVGNANVTDTIASILAIWQEDNDTQLRTHINTIVNIQDFLCRILTDASSEDARAIIGQLLGEIVCVKDDLKQFINNTRYETI